MIGCCENFFRLNPIETHEKKTGGYNMSITHHRKRDVEVQQACGLKNPGSWYENLF